MPVVQNDRDDAETAEMSRRERKKQATRQCIHEAAFELAEKHGLGALTIEAITERADVAPRTFFNYFSSKENAVLGFDPEFGAGLVSALEKRPEGEGILESLRTVIADHLLDKDPSVEAFRRRMALIRSDQALSGAQASNWVDLEYRLAGVIAERVGGGEDATTYGRRTAAVVTAAMRAACVRWAELGGDKKLPEMIDDVFDWLAAGLPQPVGPEREGSK